MLHQKVARDLCANKSTYGVDLAGKLVETRNEPILFESFRNLVFRNIKHFPKLFEHELINILQSHL